MGKNHGFPELFVPDNREFYQGKKWNGNNKKSLERI
jgi:hypothetical protein